MVGAEGDRGEDEILSYYKQTVSKIFQHNGMEYIMDLNTKDDIFDPEDSVF